MKTFNVGDVVCLKSGGPQMTVEDNSYVSHVGCVWFEGTELKRQIVLVNALQSPAKEPSLV